MSIIVTSLTSHPPKIPLIQFLLHVLYDSGQVWVWTPTWLLGGGIKPWKGNFFPHVFGRFLSLLLFSPVSTCITTCKKAAPPPVPPRTTSKPYISVTVQSSTESAQDNYLDQQDRRSEVNSQSSHAHSNSSDSLDSTRANSLARGIPRPPHIIPTPIATPREPVVPITINASTETSDSAIQHESLKSGLNKGNLVVEEPLVAPVPRRKLSSIGIQVGDASRYCWISTVTTY